MRDRVLLNFDKMRFGLSGKFHFTLEIVPYEYLFPLWGKRMLGDDYHWLRISIPFPGKTHERRTNNYEYIFPLRGKGDWGNDSNPVTPRSPHTSLR